MKILLYICTTVIAAVRTNVLNLSGQHHAKESSIGYLISSLLVFGSGTNESLDQLNIEEEGEQFFSALRSYKQSKGIHNPANNIGAEVTGRSKCIHYSGHGYSNYLAFQNAKRIGETHLVHHDLIRCTCEDEDQRSEFVFANACCSEHAVETFIEACILHAACVTKHFYNTLLHGSTILKAFHTEKEAVAAMSSDEWKFLSLPKDDSIENNKHHVKLFSNLNGGHFVNDTKLTPPIVQYHLQYNNLLVEQWMDNDVRLFNINW